MIDGYTQPGARPNTLPLTKGDDAPLGISINGTRAGGKTVGLVVRAPTCTIRGSSIIGFSLEGIDVLGASAPSVTVAGNFLELTPSGRASSDQDGGEFESGDPSGVIGGPSPADRNVISGHAVDAVDLKATRSSNVSRRIAEGNEIGTTPAGQAAAPNRSEGVAVTSAVATIRDNLVSGNKVDGIDNRQSFRR